MKAEDVKVDLEELRKFKKQNFKERLEFIDYLADYIKKHPEKKWSKQQAVVIDSQVKK